MECSLVRNDTITTLSSCNRESGFGHDEDRTMQM